MKKTKKEQVALNLLAMQRHSWEQGVAMQAFLEAKQMDVVIAMVHEAVYRSMEDGRAATIGVNDAVTDPCSVGEALVAACKETGDLFLIRGRDALLRWALEKAPRNEKGVLYHLTTQKQMWADSAYMLPPFLAAAGYYQEALTNLFGYWELLFDKEAKLMCHIWDDEKKEFIRKAHWGGGSGWTLAAIARMLRLLPVEEYAKERERLIDMGKELLEGVMAHMREDGLFHDVVDEPDTFVETNLSQMTAYTIYRGMTDRWLEKEIWKEKAAFLRAAANKKVDAFGFVRDVCGAPSFDKAGVSPEGQAFYLLMETAGEDYEQ